VRFGREAKGKQQEQSSKGAAGRTGCLDAPGRGRPRAAKNRGRPWKIKKARRARRRPRVVAVRLDHRPHTLELRVRSSYQSSCRTSWDETADCELSSDLAQIASF